MNPDRRCHPFCVTALCAAALAVAAASCGSTGSGAGTSDHTNGTDAPDAAARLRRFADCTELMAYIEQHASAFVDPESGSWTPWGDDAWDGDNDEWDEDEDDDEEWDAADGGAGGDDDGDDDGNGGNGELPGNDGGGSKADESHSGTNNQEDGVDEPDFVKTDGDRMFALVRDHLYYMDVSTDTPKKVAALQLPEGASEPREMLFWGDRLFLFSVEPTIDETWVEPILATRITEVEISSDNKLRVVAMLTVTGDYVSARAVGSTARVALRSGPRGLPFKHWREVLGEWEGDLDDPHLVQEAKRLTREYNLRLIEDSEPDNWLPGVKFETSGDSQSGALYGCDAAFSPSIFSGLDALSVFTIDLAQGLGAPPDGIGLLSAGETVYASTENMYVATRAHADSPGAAQRGVLIHKFRGGNEPGTEYLGSGELPGTLMSQWSMSEFRGDLRVVTTTNYDETSVSILRSRDKILDVVGSVGGIGFDERVFAVRFIGSTGYVVTFRRTDPLYTIDVSDPTSPRVVGELQINGYSAYLHPMGDGYLLGVGQDGTADGDLTGAQVSLFDVSDPSNPRRIHQANLGNGESPVEFDHRAFLSWPAREMVVLPVTRHTSTGVAHESIALRVSAASGFSELGRVSMPQPWEEANADGARGYRRSVVVDNVLYSMFAGGLVGTDMDNGFTKISQTSFLD
ncbi:MAG: beta-propeller domain-containing protein [Nannocystaceae bacterium]